MTKPIKKVKVFYCYSRKDDLLREALEHHLEPLKHSGQILVWHDREIQPGMNWKQEIDIRLNSSNIILLLVSANFIKSDYCYSIEMQKALAKHKAGEARVIPIILRPVLWKETPLGDLQALPTNGKPITLWRNRDEAFEDVAKGIQKVVGSFLSEKQKSKEECLKEGNILYKQRRYEEALAAYEQVTQLDPYYADAFCNKGHVLRVLAQNEEALAAYEQTIRLNPSDCDPYYGMGLLRRASSQGRLELYSKAAELDPNLAFANYARRSVIPALKGKLDALRAWQNHEGATAEEMRGYRQEIDTFERAINLELKEPS